MTEVVYRRRVTDVTRSSKQNNNNGDGADFRSLAAGELIICTPAYSLCSSFASQSPYCSRSGYWQEMSILSFRFLLRAEWREDRRTQWVRERFCFDTRLSLDLLRWQKSISGEWRRDSIEIVDCVYLYSLHVWWTLLSFIHSIIDHPSAERRRVISRTLRFSCYF